MSNLELKDYLKYWKDHKMCACFSILNRKGGVGKSVNSLSFAHTLSKNGFKVLLIDNDPQQSSTNILGINTSFESDPIISMKNMGIISRELKETTNDVYAIDDLYGASTDIETINSDNAGYHDLIELIENNYPITNEDINKAILNPSYKQAKIKRVDNKSSIEELSKVEYDNIPYGFDLLPSSEELADDELYLSSDSASEMAVKRTDVLKTIVDAIKTLERYDIILIDCPPSLSILTINALVASDGIIMPGMPEFQSLYSLAKMKKNIRDIKSINPKQCGILGFLLSAVSKNNITAPIIKKEVIDTLKIRCFDTVVPQSVKAQQATAANLCFTQVDKKAYSAFVDISKEVLAAYFDNIAWEEYRNNEIRKAYDNIINNEKEIVDGLTQKAITIVDSKLMSKGINKETYDTNKYKLNVKNTFNRLVNNYIKEQYIAGELWEECTSEFHSTVVEDYLNSFKK